MHLEELRSDSRPVWEQQPPPWDTNPSKKKKGLKGEGKRERMR